MFNWKDCIDLTKQHIVVIQSHYQQSKLLRPPESWIRFAGKHHLQMDQISYDKLLIPL